MNKADLLAKTKTELLKEMLNEQFERYDKFGHGRPFLPETHVSM